MLKDTDIRFYEINHDYINYMKKYSKRLYEYKKIEQNNERKYIGMVLYVNDKKLCTTPISKRKAQAYG